ncbi:MAG: hypothetical protein Q8L38_01950, partial [Pseudohongiella sp.]|nr:hypothetical protein [Pseudohongiella sp.]
MQTYQGSDLQIPTLVGLPKTVRVLYFQHRPPIRQITLRRLHADLQHQSGYLAALVELYLVFIHDRRRIAGAVSFPPDTQQWLFSIPAV